ncbi:hypothetical protein NG829_20850 [Xanthomonas sacchari]|uniref:hypothetical protein n=1 Tax=Xanthomonas sacchari TaxID=56458 RepID=UPI00225DE170|nr:hypothetical protein [Xanthomonas sacchari]UYK80745.1 hypothetical protein NG829_20850 [Xanthomonas sacchari]
MTFDIGKSLIDSFETHAHQTDDDVERSLARDTWHMPGYRKTQCWNVPANCPLADFAPILILKLRTSPMKPDALDN